MNYSHPSHRRILPKYLLEAAAAFLLPAMLQAAGVTVRILGDSDVGAGGKWMRGVAQEWAQKTGNTLEYINRPKDASATLQQCQQYWAAHSADVDVYMIDVIWPGIAAPHAVDLKKYYKDDEIKQFFPRIIENNIVGGKLISIPFFTDAGLLYYRTDLLKKYGYSEPPKTWEELAEMAKKIQDGERKEGKADFQGFVFEGTASESITCNAVEWIYSFGGGSVIEPDKKITINNPNAIKALDTAKSWVGSISPRGVTTYQEDDARNVWQQGNAAFMRNWPYAYGLGNAPDSVIAGKFDIVVLPKGGPSGKNAACLGGWNLMVCAYSKNPDVAADLVKYLSSTEIQKRHATEINLLPTRPELYKDQEVLAKNPAFARILDVLNNAVARPSTVTGSDYGQISAALYQNANKVLNGEETGQQAVSAIERVAKGVMQ
jgi:trehalose/maltose transport system substrate-binding protein